jgi:hypothetical protein
MNRDEFFQSVRPLIDQVVERYKERVKRLGSDQFVATASYGEKMRLLWAAAELSSKPAGSIVRVDRWTSVDRDGFVKYLNESLAGESEETVWVPEDSNFD